MIEPLLADDALIADINAAPDASDVAHLWWLGQSGFLVKWNCRKILFDPYLSDSLTVKYAATDKPHVRMTARSVAPDRLTGLDFVTSSHNHTDHLDADTLVPLFAANPQAKFVIPKANRAFVEKRLGSAIPSLVEMTDRAAVTADWCTWHGIAAAHNALDRDANDDPLFMGYVVQFGPFQFFHSGDTLWHDGLVEKLRALGSCDAVFLPINGNRPERRVAGNLNGTEAAALARACVANLVIPCHYDMFTFNTEPPDEFVAACGRLNQPFRVLQCGERLSLTTRCSTAVGCCCGGDG